MYVSKKTATARNHAAAGVPQARWLSLVMPFGPPQQQPQVQQLLEGRSHAQPAQITQLNLELQSDAAKRAVVAQLRVIYKNARVTPIGTKPGNTTSAATYASMPAVDSQQQPQQQPDLVPAGEPQFTISSEPLQEGQPLQPGYQPQAGHHPVHQPHSQPSFQLADMPQPASAPVIDSHYVLQPPAYAQQPSAPEEECQPHPPGGHQPQHFEQP